MKNQRMRTIFLSIIMVLLFSIVTYAATVWYGSYPNQASNTHKDGMLNFRYDGYVQIQSSYRNPIYGHAARGYIIYNSGRSNSSGYQYTPWGGGITDNHLYTKSYTYYDSIDPFAPPTTFHYGFYWVPPGSQWPVSQPAY
jgi:hypothetical protein